MTCFLLIRHGATDHNGQVLSGRRGGIELNRNGHAQAASLPRRLVALPPDLLCSSPLERCQQTAAPVAAAFDLEPRIMPELHELDYGQWQGQTLESLDQNPVWKTYNQTRSVCRIPGGELLVEAQLRMLRALELLWREAPDATVAVVGHGDPIRAIVAYCLGMPLDMINRLVISTGSVNVITMGVSEPRVHCINSQAPLEESALFV